MDILDAAMIRRLFAVRAMEFISQFIVQKGIVAVTERSSLNAMVNPTAKR
jgi:hypothetical protein